MATPLTDAINALTTYANETTGASDTNLSDAVGTLVDGYGQGGGGVKTGTITPSERTTSITIDVGTNDVIKHLVMFPTSETPLKSNGKTVIGVIANSESAFFKYIGITSNNTGSSFLTPANNTKDTYFTQTGANITVSPIGAGMFETITYTWVAW